MEASSGFPRFFLRTGKTAFTLIELIVVFLILTLALAMAIVHFRNSRLATSSLTSAIVLQMEVRRASDILKESLLDCSEVVKPSEGNSLPYLVVKDIINQTKVFYLEESQKAADRPFQLVVYTDAYTGTFQRDHRKILFGKVKEISFTNLSPGIVITCLTLADENKKDVKILIESPLKNLGSMPDE